MTTWPCTNQRASARSRSGRAAEAAFQTSWTGVLDGWRLAGSSPPGPPGPRARAGQADEVGAADPLGLPCPLRCRQRTVGVGLALKAGEERGPPGRAGDPRVVGGVQSIGADAPAQGARRRIEPGHVDDAVTPWRRVLGILNRDSRRARL